MSSLPAAVAALAIGYLCGGIMVSYLIGRLSGVDIRATGSANPGATNLYRAAGFPLAAAGFIGDALKGALAIIFVRLLIPQAVGSSLVGVMAAVGAILGHTFPPMLRFRGGKAVATAAGTVMVLSPLSVPILAAVWLVAYLAFGYVSLASVIIAALFPVVIRFTQPEAPLMVFSLVTGTFVIYKHRENIVRLLRGEEHRARRRGK